MLTQVCLFFSYGNQNNSGNSENYKYPATDTRRRQRRHLGTKASPRNGQKAWELGGNSENWELSSGLGG